MNATPLSATTVDSVLDGRVRLEQPARGYRAGLDAALLAAACPAEPGQTVVEAGCGVGAVLLQVAARRANLTLAGLERDPAAVALARANAVLNGRGPCMMVSEGDVAAGFSRSGLPRGDWALCNPPFFDDPSTLRPPDPSRHGAWMADAGLAAWVGFLGKAVSEGGHVVVIHRADRLADLLALFGAGLGSVQIRPVHPRAEEPAKRVLIRATKTGRAPLRLLPPLVVHRGDGLHTETAEAILRGHAALDWL